MSRIITTKSPLFWLIVSAGVIIPALSLQGAVRVAVTLLVVAIVAIGLVWVRRQERGVAGRR
jgi:hypothetical protein